MMGNDIRGSSLRVECVSNGKQCGLSGVWSISGCDPVADLG